jgi:hypothetical protein
LRCSLLLLPFLVVAELKCGNDILYKTKVLGMMAFVAPAATWL